jgi:cytochrome c-type protein NapB
MKKMLLGIMMILSINTLNADVNLGACKGCHGQVFEKKALGKSQVVADMNATSISGALIGYKNGTYGGAMKSMMAGQVARYSVEDLNATGEIIVNLTKVK